MPTTVYETVEIKLSNDQNITIKPLTIKHLKKFLAVVKKLQDSSVKTEDDAMEVFIEAGMVCMEQFAPELAADKDLFENTIEIPTLMKILEVAGGLKLNNDDPNFPGANLTGNLQISPLQNQKPFSQVNGRTTTNWNLHYRLKNL